MNDPMVIRFQRMALNDETSTVDLLRMAKAIAVKLQLKEVIRWIDWELNGYSSIEDLPEYRKTKGKLLGHNPINGLIPMMVSNQKDEDFLRTVYITSPITELSLAYGDPNATMIFPISTEFSNELQQDKPDFLRFPIVRRIGQSKMLNIVERVRNDLLNWSLELEQQGILGEDLKFTESDKKKAIMTTNNFNFNGNINNSGVIGAENHDFSQSNNIEITAGDFESLKIRLEELGFIKNDIQELKEIIESEPTTIKPDGILPKIYSWLGKAGERVINIGIDKSAPLAIEAIMKYIS